MQEPKQTELIYSTMNGLVYEAHADDSLYLFLKCLDTLWSVPHYHDSIEIVCVVEGEIKVHIDGKIYRLSPEQICFIDARQVHFYENDYPKCKSIVLTVSSEYTHHFRKQFPSKTFPSYMDNIERNHSIVEFLKEFSQKTNLSYLSACGYTNLLLDLILQVYPLDESVSVPQKHPSRNFIDYIHQNYKKDISLKSMAKEFGYTPEHFSKLFNKAVGMNFLTVLNNYRLQRVLEQYNSLDNVKSLIQLSYECGFTSSATFYRYYSVYKKKMIDLPIS